MNKKNRQITIRVILAVLVMFLVMITVSAIQNDGTNNLLGQSETLQLGASGQDITIKAPDRKIGLGTSGFDLLTGVKATYPDGTNADTILQVESDGGFDADISNEYKVDISAKGSTSVASRKITVTEYTVNAEPLKVAYNPTPETNGKDGEGDIIQPDITAGMEILGKNGGDYSCYLEVVDSGGFDVRQKGVYNVDYAVVHYGEILVQTNRVVEVGDVASSFGVVNNTDFYSVGEDISRTDSKGTVFKFYMLAGKNGQVGFNDSRYSPQYQFFASSSSGQTGGQSNGVVWFVTKGGVTQRYSTGYLDTNTGTSGMAWGSLGSLGTPTDIAFTDNDTTVIYTWNKLATDGLIFKMTARLDPSSIKVNLSFSVENQTGSPISYSVFQGGDTYFAGDDTGSSHYNARSKTVYIRKQFSPELVGMMSYRASELTPAQYFWGGQYSKGQSYFVGTGNNFTANLPGDFSVSNPNVNLDDYGNVSTSRSIDQSFYLQWIRENIPTGTTSNVDGEMLWTEPGNVQIIAPENKRAPSGVVLPYAFLLENMTTTNQTVTLSVTSSNGWGATIYGGNTVTVPASGSLGVTVYLTIPAGQPNNKVDTLTLTLNDTAGNTVRGRVETTIDNSLAAIQDIRITSQTNTELRAAIDFKNIPANEARSTFVQILDEYGAELTPKKEMTITNYKSGEENRFIFDISNLTLNKDYIIRSKVQGIDYHFEKMFTLSSIANSIDLTRNAASAPATLNVNKTNILTEKLVATISPANVLNKTINWSAVPAANMTAVTATQSGAVKNIPFAKDGVVTVKAKAAAASFPEKTIVYTVDTQDPSISLLSVSGGGAINAAARLNVTAADIIKDGYQSGLDKIYYRVMTTATAPTFNPANTAGWTVYTNTASDTVFGTNGQTLYVYAVAVDKVGNYVLKKHDVEIKVDTTVPVVTASDVHVYKGTTLTTVNDTVKATDNGVTMTLNTTNTTIKINGTGITGLQIPISTLGRYSVEYTVKDAAGNSAVKTHFVYVHGEIELSLTTPIYLHINDIASDINFLTSPRIGLVSKVQYTNTAGAVTPTNITPTHNAGTKVTFGVVGTYTVTYTGAHTYPGAIHGVGPANQSKTANLQVIVRAENPPTAPSLTVNGEGSFTHYQGFPAGAVTKNDITARITATQSGGGANIPISESNWTIKKGAATVTFDNAIATIGNYTVLYKVTGSDGSNAYKTLPFEVIGTIEFANMGDIHTLQDIASPTKTEGQVTTALSSATYKREVSGVVNTLTATIVPPSAIAVGTVQKSSVSYSATYGGSLGAGLTKTQSRTIFVQGIPVVQSAGTIYLHKRDTSADFNPMTDPRVGLKATVQVVDNSGNVTTNNITTGLSFTGTINWTTKNDTTLTYKAVYQHANIAGLTAGTKNTEIKFTDDVPGAPSINLTATTLRTFRDYAANQITGAGIVANVVSPQGTLTYKIKDRSGTERTLSYIHTASTPIANYTIEYKLLGADNKTSYKDVPLEVYGKITFAGLNTIHVVQQASGKLKPQEYQVPASGYAPVTATYERYNTSTSSVENAAATLAVPGEIGIDTVSAVPLSYTAQYPFTGGPTENGPRKVFVHGIPVITATTPIGINIADTSADFNPLTDSRVGLSAKVDYINSSGTKQTQVITNASIVLKGGINPINYGVNGSYDVVYQVPYAHVYDGKTLNTTGESKIAVIVDDSTPGGPDITIDPGVLASGYWHFQDSGTTLTDAHIRSTISVTPGTAGATVSSFTYEIKTQDNPSNTVSLATAIAGTPKKYTVVFKAVDDAGRTSYAYVELKIVGKINVTAGTRINTGEASTPLATNIYDANSVGAPKASFVSYNGSTVNAAVTIPSGNIGISTVEYKTLPYAFNYPSEYPQPTTVTGRYASSRELAVHGYPVITANSITVNVLDPPVDLKDFVGINLAATANYISGNTVTPKTFTKSEINLAGTVNWGTVGTYPLTYSATYTPAGTSLILAQNKTITVIISDAGDPDAPKISLNTNGKNPLYYFQGFTHPSNVVDDASIKANVKVEPQAGSTVTLSDLSYKVLSNGVETTLAQAKNTIGMYTIRYSIKDSSGRVGYFSINFHVVGTITLGNANPIDVIKGASGSTLPAAEYTGGNAITATFTNASGTSENATLAAVGVTIDAVGQKKVAYTATYPSSYGADAALNMTKDRLVRVHDLPVITDSKGNRLDLRTATSSSPISDANLLEGLSAQVILAGKNDGDTNTTQPVNVVITSAQSLTDIGKFNLGIKAEININALGYNSIVLAKSESNRVVVLHGHVEVTGNDISLNKNFVASDFETLARSKMNVKASVKYYNVGTSSIDTVVIPVTHPNISGILFGTVGSYNQGYSVNDNTAAGKPAGLTGQTTNRIFKVNITDSTIGDAPIVSITSSSIDWLTDARISAAEVMVGVSANDSEDGSVVGRVTVKAMPVGGGLAVPLGAGATSLPPGPYTLVYTVSDSDGNTVSSNANLYVHGNIQVRRDMAITNARVCPTAFVPDITPLVMQYVDGTTGQAKEFTADSDTSCFATCQNSYDVSTLGNSFYTVTVHHPIFNTQFTAPASGAVVSTSLDRAVELKVHDIISLSGYNAYNADQGSRTSTSYFAVGDSLDDAVLKTGVTAGYMNSDNIPVDLTNTIKIAAPSRQNAVPGTFEVEYSVSDNLIHTVDTKEKILIEVDSLPAVKIQKNPVYVHIGTTEAETLAIAGITANIYYGKNPTVPVTLAPVTTFTYNIGTDFSAAGNSADLKAVAAHPQSGRSTDATTKVYTYIRPVTTINGSKHIEMFKGELTEAEISKMISPTAKYTDIYGQVVVVDALVDFTDVDLEHGGKYQLYSYIMDPYTDVRINSSDMSDLFVLNQAYVAHHGVYYGEYDFKGAGYIAGLLAPVKGVGERVIDGTVTKQTFALTAAGAGARAAGSQVVVEDFEVDKDLSRFSFEKYNEIQKIKITGVYPYRDQKVTATIGIYISRTSSEGGTSTPDKDPQKPATGGTGGAGVGAGGGGTGSGMGPKGETGLSNEAVEFWRATRQLIETVGNKKETWSIKHDSYKNPTKINSTGRKIIAVPGDYLSMPSYVLDELEEQSGQRLQLNIGENYRWYIGSDGKWEDSVRTSYPIAITDGKNNAITKLLGSEVDNQQLTFGINDGWNTNNAVVAAKITNADLQGETLYMYMYNEYTKELELVGEMDDLGANWYSVKTSGEYGDYVITDVLYKNAKVYTKTETNPETGGVLYIPKYAYQLIEDGLITLPSADKIMNFASTSSEISKTQIFMGVASILLLGLFIIWKKKNNEMDKKMAAVIKSSNIKGM